ncbi:hypothetical protein C8R44DRAFT_143399 [Mycena epipterygia]|nr:hypothetical protein C8R44DRAFT_143399 [Mycena epipterygia]
MIELPTSRHLCFQVSTSLCPSRYPCASGMHLRHSLIPLGLLQLWSSWPSLVHAQQSFFPAAVPLAVRSPTFNCWLDTRNGSNPTNTWPTFWNDQHTLGWAGYIKVDGSTWHWLGNPVPGNASTWISTEITPTRTIITVQAGPMLLNVTFLSPVEPSDWSRQSFPFSYMYIDGASTDGNFHSVQLYSDISGEWVTNSLSTPIQWTTSKTGSTVYHQVKSSTPGSVFTDVAEDSVAYYAVSAEQPGLVSVVGNDVTLRPQFAKLGDGFTLTTDIAAQSGNVDSSGKFPVFAHAIDLGQTQSISSVVWAVGLIRDPLLTYIGTNRRSYFWSQYSTIDDAIEAFMADFPAARTRALVLDQQILHDAGAVSQNYADLVSLATRQAMAGVEITLSTTADGSWNTSDVLAFMKDVGSTQRVNPTEAIYAAMPALLYLNASISGALLEPLLRFQNSSAYTNPYAATDLGNSYPNAPGNTNNEDVYGVEDSGNMIILALAHARTSGDGSLIEKYYNLFKQWADYLVTNALIPAQQTPADGRDMSLAQNHGNITNLAIKGIIAIQAMSEISQIKGNAADAQKYSSAATSSAQSWVTLTSSSGSPLWKYGEIGSSGLMYNLLADRLLGLNLVPSSIYTDESSTLSSQTVPSFGFPLSSESGVNTRSDWTLFSAAAAPDTLTRDLLISGVHKRASTNATNTGPFSNLYNVQTGAGGGAGSYPNGFGSPAQGAMFSVLSLSVPNKTVIIPTPAAANASPTSSNLSSNHHTATGAIVGGVIAGLFVLLVLGFLGIFLRRRRQRQRSDADEVFASPRPYREPQMANLDQAMSVSQPPTSPTSDPQTGPPSRAFNNEITVTPFPLSKAALRARGRPLPEPSSPGSEQPSTSHLPSVSGTTSSVSRGTDLRNEMDMLRREVEELRAAQGLPQDAPPMYQ